MKIVKGLRLILLIAVVVISGYGLQTGRTEDSSLLLMPWPEHIERNHGKFVIDQNLKIYISGHSDRRLMAAVSRMVHRLGQITGFPIINSPITEIVSDEPTFRIHCIGAGEEIQSPDTDESYALDVNSQSVHLSAESPIGILRGMETFLQLVEMDDESFFIPLLSIKDRPRFRWRGLLIDVARHWQPPEIIRRNLDAMAALKMNVLHWHLSDDQGFRMESKIFPKLHQVGSKGRFYNQKEAREIIRYAQDRGIRIIPEFDMPGHTTAWLSAYSELASAPGPYQIEDFWGIRDPCMDPTRESVYLFLDQFIGEMADIFPDEYFHIGGDEVNGKHWNANSEIRDFKERHKLKDNHALQAYFNQRLLKILEKHGKKMIGWDEILHPDLPNNVTVQSWRGMDSLAKSVSRGSSAILSYGYYLDHMQSAAFHYAIDPQGKEAAALTDKEKTQILGGEACMWGEFITEENIESRVWPRTAAIAERLWSPTALKDEASMYRRLQFIDRYLASLGLRHKSQYATLLQRLAGKHDPAPLRIFADLLEPSGLGVRARTRKYSRLIPLNRMVDAVPPESETARRFTQLVHRALKDPAGSQEDIQRIREHLNLWAGNQVQLKPITRQSFLLHEIEPLAEIVLELCAKGLQALDYIVTGEIPSKEWHSESVGLMGRSGKPMAEMTVAIVPAIEMLIEAAKANRRDQ